MKEYQAARKKLEQRRLAYDTSLAKMQKAKKEDFRVEEELRSQKAKYEEASDDVYRRMQDIQEAEVESISDLGAFLDAELSYYDRAREALLDLKGQWPAGQVSKCFLSFMANKLINISQTQFKDQRNGTASRLQRSRSNTAHSYSDRFAVQEEPPPPSPESRPAIKSHRTVSNYSTNDGIRPNYARSTTFEGPAQLRRDFSPTPSINSSKLSRIPSDSLTIRTSNTRPMSRIASHTLPGNDVFNDQYDSGVIDSPDRSYDGRSISPATSHGSFAAGSAFIGSKKGPPPPPPSRAKKPPPPPPPAKRAI